MECRGSAKRPRAKILPLGAEDLTCHEGQYTYALVSVVLTSIEASTMLVAQSCRAARRVGYCQDDSQHQEYGSDPEHVRRKWLDGCYGHANEQQYRSEDDKPQVRSHLFTPSCYLQSDSIRVCTSETEVPQFGDSIDLKNSPLEVDLQVEQGSSCQRHQSTRSKESKD